MSLCLAFHKVLNHKVLCLMVWSWEMCQASIHDVLNVLVFAFVYYTKCQNLCPTCYVLSLTNFLASASPVLVVQKCHQSFPSSCSICSGIPLNVQLEQEVYIQVGVCELLNQILYIHHDQQQNGCHCHHQYYSPNQGLEFQWYLRTIVLQHLSSVKAVHKCGCLTLCFCSFVLTCWSLKVFSCCLSCLSWYKLVPVFL